MPGLYQRLKRSSRIFAVLLVALLGGPVHAAIDTYEFEHAEQQSRYHRFITEMRCPKCQNQNLADSNAPIAADLRRELHRMIVAGHSDEQIVAFMVERYGDFILYRPPLDRNTVLLWVLPVVFLLLGGLLVFFYMRRFSAGKSANADPERLSDREAEQLKRILERYQA